MILLVCLECRKGLRISPGDQRGSQSEAEALFGPHTEHYPDKYPCPWGKGCLKLIASSDPRTTSGLEVYDVNPQEAFAALHGLGLPDERDCSAAAVSKLLEGALIARVRTKQIRGSHRCLIDFIELQDGTRAYVGGSAYGATIYRVSRASSYVDKLSNE